MRGTAFLVGGGKLLTARHVVDEYYNGNKPVVACFLGVNYTFIPQKVGTDRNPMDVVVLDCTNSRFAATELAQKMYLKLMPIPYAPSEDMTLSVIGFPSEIAGGGCQIETVVRPHSRVDKTTSKYDVVTVRDGQFELNSYGGFSGSPVLTKAGYVVGVVSTETFGKLTYCSVDRMARTLKKLGVTDIESRWEVFEDSNLSLQYSREQVEKAFLRTAGRYREETHANLAVLEDEIKDFTDYDRRERNQNSLRHIADNAAKQLREALNTGNALSPLPTGFKTVYTEKTFDNLPDFIRDLRKVVAKGTAYRDQLKKLEQSAIQKLEKMERMKKPLLCLHGKAGTGKTQISCHIARQMIDERKNNVFLLFGSQFDAKKDAWDCMLDLLKLKEDDINNLEKRAKDQNHYAVFIIDALNEGVGDIYWKQQLRLLVEKIIAYPHFKLIFSIRVPFVEGITTKVDQGWLHMIELEGLTPRSTQKAIDKYFDKYKIGDQYRDLYKKQFRKPLFLVIFCESYWLLSQYERDHINLRLLYKTYLTTRNVEVSRRAEEDEKRNVTLTCMRQLAWLSVEQCLAGLIPREKARRVADKICPMRTWRNNLLHALLDENLLMDTLSDQIPGDMVMFEFENIADVMKAESLLMSKLTDDQIVQLLVRTNDELEQRELSKAKFHNMVCALIALWDRKTDVTNVDLFTVGRFNRQLFSVEKDYPGERNTALISNWKRNTFVEEKYDPRELLHKLDDKKTPLFDTLHPYLQNMEMSKRDEKWTIKVNEFLEGNGALYYIERMSKNPQYRHRFLPLITWMLTTSDPEYRQYLIRLLYRELMENPQDVLTMMDLFEHCNDHYLLQGLYCAIYGLTLRSKEEKLLQEIARRVYKRFYESPTNVPVDIVLRQWTLKILERVESIMPIADYFKRIVLPFKSQDPVLSQLKEGFGDIYFGEGKGAHMLYFSMNRDSDFHRYTIGSNNGPDSHEFFTKDEVDGPVPVKLQDIVDTMAPIIRRDLKYSDALSTYDGGRHSRERHHNRTERIGKKYQWLALDSVYARLTDNYWVKDQRSDSWDIGHNGEKLTRKAWPWMTRRYDRFDPTMPSNEEIEQYSKEFKLFPEKDVDWHDTISDYNEWILSEASHPVVNMQWTDRNGQEWVRFYGFEMKDHLYADEKRATMLYYNTLFAHKSDVGLLIPWAEEKTFNGRWMEERTDCNEFLWNEMPWSDSYRRLKRDEWTAGDSFNPYPCKLKVAYDEQLQEEVDGFLHQDESFSYSASMPCAEMMQEMNLYTAERGIVRCVVGDSVAAINMSIINRTTGLLVRKDMLCEFLKKKKYALFTFLLGSKQSGPNKDYATLKGMEDLSGCMMMNEKGEWKEIQKLRIVTK